MALAQREYEKDKAVSASKNLKMEPKVDWIWMMEG